MLECLTLGEDLRLGSLMSEALIAARGKNHPTRGEMIPIENNDKVKGRR
jgi:hypothetical protein